MNGNNILLDTNILLRRYFMKFKHTTKTCTVTIAGKDSLDLPTGTLKSILKQANLD